MKEIDSFIKSCLPNEPIFVEDIVQSFPNHSRQWVDDSLKAMVLQDRIKRFSIGVYYIPLKYQNEELKLNAQKVVEKKYSIINRRNMLNFTIGPVQSADCVKAIGAQDVPYFRTQEFSHVMFENESLVKKFANAPEESRVVFITGSGTASMEAAVMNCFSSNDLVMIVNGGSFGQRFVEICTIHNIPYIEIKPEFGEGVSLEMLEKSYSERCTGFLVNMGETSTGVLYDINMIGSFCKQRGLFLVVDAISTFLADEFDMKQVGADVMISGSQKALACPPGVSFIVLSQRALERVSNSKTKTMYLDLKRAIKDGERGQTPFTPAVGILLQINARLHEIDNVGGAKAEIERTHILAEDFRNRIKYLPLEICSNSLSNAVTPLHPLNGSAYDIFLTLKNDYQIWVCPNGGKMADSVFRVGHIGNLKVEDNSELIRALKDLSNKGLY